MFNLAIDSKLRGCDVVTLKVEDVAPNGCSLDRARVRQKKTGGQVKFELTEQTRQAVDDYLTVAGKKPGEFMFTGRRGPARGDNRKGTEPPAFAAVLDRARRRNTLPEWKRQKNLSP